MRKGVRAVAVAALCFSGCITAINPDASETVDQIGTSTGPIVQFLPPGIFPIPNDLLRSMDTGLLSLPAFCDESEAQTLFREEILNQLDGFAGFGTRIVISFSDAIDLTTIPTRFKLLQRTAGGMDLSAASATEIPFTVLPAASTQTIEQFSEDCASSTLVPAITIVPDEPLADDSHYTFALLDGVTTPMGGAVNASPFWSLVRQAENPVTVEDGEITEHTTPLDENDLGDRDALLLIAELWDKHADAVAFLVSALGVDRDDLLVGGIFKTQTVQQSYLQEEEVPEGLKIPVPLNDYGPLTDARSIIPLGDDADDAVASILGFDPCDAEACIGDVVVATLRSRNFQVPDSLGVPGPWDDPLQPNLVGINAIEAFVIVPANLRNGLGSGAKAVIYGHDLMGSVVDALSIGSRLAQEGIATIAINWVAHGDRAIREAAPFNVGHDICSYSVEPEDAPECFAPFISPNLGTTRDNFRQSALDLIALVQSIHACNACSTMECITGCGYFQAIDASDLGYLGHGLGALIGVPAIATQDSFSSAVLNATGVGLVDILEESPSSDVHCLWVDALIEAGLFDGVVSDHDGSGNGKPMAIGTCTDLTRAHLDTLEWQALSLLARTAVDAAEVGSFLEGASGFPLLLQQVGSDETIGSTSTERLGSMLMLSQITADAGLSDNPPPTTSLLSDPNGQHWLNYPDLDANMGTGFLGNSFDHDSLLRPTDPDGGVDPLAPVYGTAQMQTDAAAFFSQNFQFDIN